MRGALLRRYALELIFWGTSVAVFIPFLSYFYFENRLKNELLQAGPNSDWKVFDELGNYLVTINLPFDFRKDPILKNRNAFVLENILPSVSLRAVANPAVVLGRIGDSDQVYINNCFVGSTGLSDNRKQLGWWWSALRVYRIPSKCLDTATEQNLNLTVRVYKWGGGPTGVFGGPIGIGDYQELVPTYHVLEALRFGTPFVFGILLILGVGTYYLFVFLLIPARRYNGWFGLTALAIGSYEIFTSIVPSRIFLNSVLVMQLTILSAILSSFLLLGFLRTRFSSISKWILKLSFWSGVVFLILSFSSRTLGSVTQVYMTWFPFFLFIYAAAFIQFCAARLARPIEDYWRYIWGFSIFCGTSAFDIFATIRGVDLPYLIPYGFVGILGCASFALAKEAADAFLHVEEQVGERTKDLAGALDQLRSLEKMKERFFANISHDFKTPVTVALGSIDEAKRDRPTGGALVSALAPAERSLHSLLGMIGDLLDTVKAESGTLKMTWEVAKPAELLREWIQPFETLCRKKGITLELDTTGCGGLKVPMDVSKLRRVFDNLMSNAVKFTDRRAEPERRHHPDAIIGVTLRTDEARFYIDVADSGIGIPKEEREKIFDRYYQSSRTSLKDHGGSGIGLSFAKEMVEIHNGDIWVEESSYGGSKFTVALPLSQDVEITGEHRVEISSAEENLRGSLDVAYPPERPLRFDPTKPTVLVAEDNPEVASVVVSALGTQYNVHFAPNGAKALDRLEREDFDCLISDIVMPQLRGDELVPKVRAMARTQSLPIVMLSSHGEDNMITTLLKSGANDYVTKPFKREILLARVQTQIESRKTAEWISKNEKVIELGFLAGGMAHQIRNGLNSLKNQVQFQKGMTEKLLESSKDLPAEEQAKLRDKLQRSNEVLGRAMDRIERLTDSVRSYNSGSKQLTDLTVEDSVSLALELHADYANSRAVQIEKKNLKGLRFLGYSAFHEVMVNLIGNAIGACVTDGTGKVTVTGRDLGKEIEISVSDNGSGITPEVLPRLCQPFFTTKAPGEGTGLGLYIVRDIVEGQHKGSLHIQSAGKGQGATFTIHIPKKAPEPARSPDVVIHGVTVS
jgi:signal transduction histidine kinase